MDSSFKFFFAIFGIVIALTVLSKYAVYNECKQEGGKGCLHKTLTPSREIYVNP